MLISPLKGNLLRHRRLCGCFDVLPGGWPWCHLTRNSRGHMVTICPAVMPGRSRFMHLAGDRVCKRLRCSGGAQRLNKLRQNATKVTRVEEGDRGAHRPVPRLLVDQPDARAADL